MLRYLTHARTFRLYFPPPRYREPGYEAKARYVLQHLQVKMVLDTIIIEIKFSEM